MMKRHTPMRRRTPLKKQSTQQAKRVYQYRLKRNEYFADEDRLCSVVVDGRRLEGCRLFATQVHHAKGRIGNLLLDEDFFVPVCDGQNCHRFLETHPAEAKALGLSLKRNT